LSIGIDIGGTKILLGLVSQSGKILKKRQVLTPRKGSWQYIMDFLSRETNELIDKSRYSWDSVTGIGIVCAGTIDRAKRKILHSPNLGWKNVHVISYLRDKFPVPLILENDCSAGAYGIYRFGEGKDARQLICIFVGTGIGGGLVFNGELFTGFNGTAGEIGHMVIDPAGPVCGCGNKGCWETLASRSALERRVEAYIKDRGKEAPGYIFLRRMKNKGKALVRAYEAEDPGVRKAVYEMGRVLGIGIANLANIIGPDIVVLGGGIIEDFEPYILQRIIKSAKKHAMAGVMKDVKIISTSLGNTAGILGAAALAQKL